MYTANEARERIKILKALRQLVSQLLITGFSKQLNKITESDITGDRGGVHKNILLYKYRKCMIISVIIMHFAVKMIKIV